MVHLHRFFREMPVNETLQIQTLAASIKEGPKRLTAGCPGYSPEAACFVALPSNKVTYVNLGYSATPPVVTSLKLLRRGGVDEETWNLAECCLGNDITGEALVAIKNRGTKHFVLDEGAVVTQLEL